MMRKTILYFGVAMALAACSAISFFMSNPMGEEPTLAPGTLLPTFSATTPTSQSPDPTQENTDTPEATAALEATLIPDARVLPDGNGFTWTRVADGFSLPTFLVTPPDGSGWLFVLEQYGRIWILDPESGQRELFMDLSDRVTQSGYEQGLLGMAFDPDYAQNGYFYLYYTNRVGDSVLARYRVSADPRVADAGSEERFFTYEQPYINHNGGMLTFGPDGMLYLGLGDGGSAGDPHGNGQSLNTYLGKILRFDVRDLNNLVPVDNPFVGSAYPLIYYYGLRNPWRFAFDARTADLYIADVGQGEYEEIDHVPAGSGGDKNFGWNLFEGYQPYQGNDAITIALVEPVAVYSHELGCSVSGGFVYRGDDLPEFQGVYLYSDVCSGNVWGLVRDGQGNWQNAVLFETGYQVTSFGLDQDGEMYLLTYDGGVFKLARR
jgi:glucose/arabinose dehydrogenase